MQLHRVDSIISGRSPPLYCTLTLISTQGYQNHNHFYLRVLDYSVVCLGYSVLDAGLSFGSRGLVYI